MPQPVPTSAAPANGTAQIQLVVPSVGTTAVHRRIPLYISNSTASVGVKINGNVLDPAQMSFVCNPAVPSGAVCTLSFPAPAGSDAFDIALGDANGNLLSEGTVTATITGGQVTVLHVTFLGMPAYVQLKFDNPNPPVGTATDVHLTASAYDAAFNLIIGDNYLQPVVVSRQDVGGHTTLSGTQLTSPSSSITVHYDGKLMAAPATFTASTPKSSNNTAATLLGNAYQAYATTYTVRSVAKGTDGNVWFTECGSNTLGSCKVGYVTPAGQVVESPNLQWAEQIAPGPDGNMWFTEDTNGYIDRITPGMVITRFQLKALAANEGFYSGPLTAAPDGTIWVAEGNNLTQINTSGQVLQHVTLACGWCYPGQVIVAANNTLWVSQLGFISNVTSTGGITNYQLYTNTPNEAIVDSSGLLALPSGNVDFQYNGAKTITPTGTISSLTLDSSVRSFGGSVTLGPDGNIWGAGTVNDASGNPVAGEAALNQSAGTITVYPPVDVNADKGGLASAVWGADGNLWGIAADAYPSNGITRFRYNP